jgi:hypothetical protein
LKLLHILINVVRRFVELVAGVLQALYGLCTHLPCLQVLDLIRVHLRVLGGLHDYSFVSNTHLDNLYLVTRSLGGLPSRKQQMDLDKTIFHPGKLKTHALKRPTAQSNFASNTWGAGLPDQRLQG